MRTKNLFITSAALLVLASCSSDFDENSTVQNVAEQTPVSFGAYSAQSTKTRSAINGLADLATPGFGVFAYFTDADNFSTNATPNFMYNQQVTGSEVTGSYNWTYSPLKFWPNDIASDGAVDSNGGTGAATGSKAGGKISFFAYAPYTENVASTGVVTGAADGITAFSKNSDTGNPTVTYKVNSANIVDLLWGTASNNNVGKVESDENQGGTLLTYGNAKVWTNITRPEKGDKIKFNFLHALSKFGGSTENIGGTEIGGVRIVLNPDAGESFGNDKETKVTVRSIKIETTGGDGANAANKFYQDGTFDLATGVWTALATPITFPKQDITNGTAADGYTGVSINSAIADNTEFSKGSAWSSLPDGVTKTPKDVYASGRTPIYAVPVAGCQPKLTVTITYVVRTQDNHLANGFSEAIQTIKKNITMPTFELNKAYGLLIRLGLTSVKFDATVSDWERGGSDTYNFASGNTNVTIVDLPANE